jgi:hypothetical protein
VEGLFGGGIAPEGGWDGEGHSHWGLGCPLGKGGMMDAERCRDSGRGVQSQTHLPS